MINKNLLIQPENILNLRPGDFEQYSIQLFNHQFNNNILYQQYCNAINIHPSSVRSINQIPFLPISFFKTHEVKTGDWQQPELRFESSGTTGETTSKHLIKNATLYDDSLFHGFHQFYGAPDQYAFLALLPSYLERKNASLVYMAQKLMEKSGHPDNGFYINEWDVLNEKLKKLIERKEKTILLGVTFALLDFAAEYPTPLANVIVMETGGMKGRREEWTRKQVHDYLKQQWQLSAIHSEYGMTELLSQAYAASDGVYTCADTMKVLIRDINDPFDISGSGTGCINIIDLANIDSCAFIATEDIGTVHANGTFEIAGRMDHTALRGCSLMAV